MSRKQNRDRDDCKQYKAENRREKHKLTKLTKLLKIHANDLQIVRKIEELKKLLRV